MPTGKVTVTTTPVLVRSAMERRFIAVTNLSASVPVYITFNGESTVTGPSGANPGIPLRPGDTFMSSQLDRRATVPNQAVWAVTESGTAEVGFHTLNASL